MLENKKHLIWIVDRLLLISGLLVIDTWLWFDLLARIEHHSSLAPIIAIAFIAAVVCTMWKVQASIAKFIIATDYVWHFNLLNKRQIKLSDALKHSTATLIERVNIYRNDIQNITIRES